MSIQTDSENTLREHESTNRWIYRGFLLAIVGACSVALSANIADPDLWGHVRYGNDVFLDGGIASTTSYSYTAEGYRWINHENIAEITLAVVATWFGPLGLVFLKFALGLFVILALIRSASMKQVGIIATAGVSLLVAINIAFHWSIRPQLFTYVNFVVMIGLLNWCFSGWRDQWHLPWFRASLGNDHQTICEELDYSSYRMRFLWLMPVLFLFWANSHGGFVAGFCLYAAYLGFRGFEAYCREGNQSWGLIRRFTLMIVVAGLATFINPYGPQLHLWLLSSLTQPRPEITEWAAIDLGSFEGMKMLILFSVFFVSLIASKRSRDFTHLMLLALTLWQSLEHHRHLPFFALLFGFWMPQHVDSLLAPFCRKDSAAEPPMTKWAQTIVACGLILVFGILGNKLYARLTDLPVENDVYPVSAIQYMYDHDLEGRLVVTYNWAQYAIAAFGSNAHNDKETQVGFDGRFRTCYPQTVVDMHFDFVIGDLGPDKRFRSPDSPSFDSSAVLEFRQPDLVLISRKQRNSVYVMEQNADTWTLLYQDDLAQVWGRSSRFGDEFSRHFIPNADRKITEEPQTGTTTWPAFPIAPLPERTTLNSPRQSE